MDINGWAAITGTGAACSKERTMIFLLILGALMFLVAAGGLDRK